MGVKSSGLMQEIGWILAGESRQCQNIVRFECDEGAGTADFQLLQICVAKSLMVALLSLLPLSGIMKRTV